MSDKAGPTDGPWTFNRPWINSVEGGPICAINDSSPNRENDAHLIAAAPDLLAALEAIVLEFVSLAEDYALDHGVTDVLEHGNKYVEEHYPQLLSSKAAIAKAKGGSA